MTQVLKPLPRKFYLRNTKTVAKDLLGKILLVKIGKKSPVVCRIVETEAYLGINDPSAHSYGNKKTARIRSMYLEGGHAYVYFIYGMYFSMNAVTQKAGDPQGVLIRAVEIAGESDSRAGAGPGKLCRYLNITKAQDGADLTDKNSPLWIADAPRISPHKIITSKRVGLSHDEAKHWHLRYYIEGSHAISKTAHLSDQKPRKK